MKGKTIMSPQARLDDMNSPVNTKKSLPQLYCKSCQSSVLNPSITTTRIDLCNW
jgi:hypothetical protein